MKLKSIRQTFSHSLVAASLAAVAMPLAPAPAMAQQTVLDEIVVTARKREESLQDTPLAVTAMDAIELRDASVYNLYDLNHVVPNIDVQAANGNSQVANIFIRGIGQRNQAPMIDSGVGIYIDGVYLGRTDGALLDLTDIASVQVLRGPQGTLFGKNTTGGAIMFTTNRPTDTLEGSVEVRLGNFDRQDAHAVLNVPLSDTWLSRLAVSSINRDGYIYNAVDGEHYADEKRVNAIAQLRWLASDDLTWDLNLNYAKTDQKVRLQKCVPLPGVIGWQAVLLDAIQVLPSTGRTYDDFCQDAADIGDEYDVLSDLGGSYVSDNKGASLVADWVISDDLSFKSISAWRYTEAGQDDELDYTAIPLLSQTELMHPAATKHETNQFTQEFLFTGSALSNRLNYVAGAHYFSEQTDGDKTVTVLGPFDPGINGLFMHTTEATLLESENKAWALFSQVEWSFNDNWKVTAGYRYTDEERKLSKEQFAVVPESLDASGSFVFPAFPGAWVVDRTSFQYNPEFGFFSTGRTSAVAEHDDGSLMASVQYLITDSDAIDNGSVYLSYNEGFLSGGLSEAPGGTLESFKPEEVENLELGFKLDLLDRRLRLNAAVFHSDYKNRQLTTIVIDPAINSPAAATINAAKSSISGIELETTWLISDKLQLMFNATFNDGDIEEFDDTQLTLADFTSPPAPGCTRTDLTVIFLDSCPIDRSGENLPRLPKKAYFAALQYDFSTRAGLFVPRIEVSYKEDIEYCFDATSCVVGNWFADEQFDLSARLAWMGDDGHWTGALYGRNLTGESYVVGGFALSESSGVGGIAMNTPRMYGVEVKYSF